MLPGSKGDTEHVEGEKVKRRSGDRKQDVRHPSEGFSC